MNSFKEVIQKVARGEKLSKDLTREEARQALQWIFEGKADAFEIGAFFAAMRMKGESSDETAGFVEAVRERAVQLHPKTEGALDLGEPYDGKAKTLHLTLPIALILSAAGIPTVLHSTAETPVKKGVETQRVLEALGIDVEKICRGAVAAPTGGETPPLQAILESILEQQKIIFLPTEKLAPDFARLRPFREAFGLRPFANHIEKIFNLANAQVQMVGIYHRPYLETMAEALTKLGAQNFFIIQGVEGFTELFISRKTLVLKGKEGNKETFWLDPAEFGFKGEEELIQGKARDHAQRIRNILAGERSAGRQSVIWNAGVKLFWMKKAESIEKGLAQAEAILDSGRLAEKLEIFREATQVITC